jgi:hypothetical protein
MVINSLARQERQYADGHGAVEHWHIDFDGRAYTCKRVVFTSAEAMERAMTALQQSLTLLETDPVAADVAFSKSVAESATIVGSLHSAETAIAFFADRRELARQAAHDLVAAVDPRVGKRVAVR